jgi:hypothetical protein
VKISRKRIYQGKKYVRGNAERTKKGETKTAGRKEIETEIEGEEDKEKTKGTDKEIRRERKC